MPSFSSQNGEEVDTTAAATTTTTSSTPMRSNPEQRATVDSEELSNSIDEQLQKMTNQFTSLGEEMLAKMDDMSRRLDGLEAQLRAAEEKDRQESTSASEQAQISSPVDTQTNGVSGSSDSG